MAGIKRTLQLDPDYAGFQTDPDEDLQVKRARLAEENARSAAVGKIRTIIDVQFTKEIEAKEQELIDINQKLSQARCVMDRLRACVIASFYAASFTKPVDGAKGPDAGAAYHPAIQNVMRKAVTAVLSKNAPPVQQTFTKKDVNTQKIIQQDGDGDGEDEDHIAEETTNEKNDVDNVDHTNESNVETKSVRREDTRTTTKEAEENVNEKSSANLGGRQRIKKTIVVGNVSKYIPPEQREGSDKSTHKWMVYVRGGHDEPRIDHFVRKVWFFLHPSYRPNDLVEVCEAPFHLTRRGWGEFPIRVQLHFCDRRSRPVDIIHQLRLDRTYTGLQTLGAETVCEVEIDESSIQLSVDQMLDVADLSVLPEEEDIEMPEDIKLTDLSRKFDPPPSKEKEREKNNSNEDASVTEPNAVEDATTHQDQSEPVSTTSAQDDPVSSPVEQKDLEASETPSDDKEKVVLNEDIRSQEEPGPVAQEDMVVDGDEVQEEEEGCEHPTPGKRRTKRRRDSCRASASEEDLMSDADQEKLLPVEVGETDDAKMKGSPEQANAEIPLPPLKPVSPTASGQQTVSQKSDDIVLFEGSPEVTDTVIVMMPDEAAETPDASAESSPSEKGSGLQSTDNSEDSSATGTPVAPLSDVTAPQVVRGISSISEDATDSNVNPQQTEKKVASPSELKCKDEKDIPVPAIAPPPANIVIVDQGPEFNHPATLPLAALKGRQPVVLLPKSSVSGPGPIRVRSVSDGDKIQGTLFNPRLGLVKSGVSVTPMLNVKIEPNHPVEKSQASATLTGSALKKLQVQKYIFLDGKQLRPATKPTTAQVISKGQTDSCASLDTQIKTDHIRSETLPGQGITKSENSESSSTEKMSQTITRPGQTNYTFPLSMLNSSEGMPSNLAGKKAHTLTLTHSPKGPYISVKASGLPLTKGVQIKPRQKRSFSADQLPRQAVCLVPVTLNPKQKPTQIHTSPGPKTVQLHIVSPPGMKKSGGGMQFRGLSPPTQTITLQALQATLSKSTAGVSSPIQITSEKSAISDPQFKNLKPVEIAGQQQYVLATVVNPKGKQQLALINPSTLTLGSMKKLVPGTSAKLLKSVGSVPSQVKSVSQVKVPTKNWKMDRKLSQQDAISMLNKLLPEPTYKVIGDGIEVNGLSTLDDETLYLVAKRVPLVSEKRKLTELPFCAQTEADFLEWNVGKQRAAEWQRAILIRRILKYLQTKSERLRECKLPSKKFVMIWCMRRGFSIFTDEYVDTDGEKSQDGEQKLPDAVQSTTTSPQSILEDLERLMVGKTRRNQEMYKPDIDEVIEIDVVGVSPPKIRPLSGCAVVKEEPMDIAHDADAEASDDKTVEENDAGPSFGDKYAGEIEMVKEITRQIGVDVSSQNGDPASSWVLAKALQQFVDRLVRGSLAASLVRRDGSNSLQRVAPEQIETADVMDAIRDHPQLDFLADFNMAAGFRMDSKRNTTSSRPVTPSLAQR